jgi:hypothetical protein
MVLVSTLFSPTMMKSIFHDNIFKQSYFLNYKTINNYEP